MPPYEGDGEKACEYGLTPREVEILCLAAEGLSSKETGARLKIDDATARYHLTGVRRKLDARSTGRSVREVCCPRDHPPESPGLRLQIAKPNDCGEQTQHLLMGKGT